MPEKRTRKTRSDKGTVQATERDLRCLLWVADQYAAQLEQLQILLSQTPGAAMKGKLLALPTVYDLVARWRRAGWIGYERFLANQTGYAWVSKRGLQLLGLDDRYQARAPAATRLKHIQMVNEIRLAMEERGYEWTSERLIRARMEAARTGKERLSGPIPDGVVRDPEGKVIAIEVELTQKKPDELEAKMRRLCYAYNVLDDQPAYPTIWFYVASENIQRAIERAQAEMLPEHRDRIAVAVSKLLQG